MGRAIFPDPPPLETSYSLPEKAGITYSPNFKLTPLTILQASSKSTRATSINKPGANYYFAIEFMSAMKITC